MTAMNPRAPIMLIAVLFVFALIANPESADDYYQGSRISPNKRWIAYTEVSRDPTLQTKTGDDVATISVMVRKVGSKTGRKIFVSYGREWAPVVAAWSPDSKRVLFWRIVYYGAGSVNADGSKLFDIARTGGRPRQLALQSQHVEDDASDFVMRRPECISFSPNGRRLLLVQGGGRFMVENKQIVRIDYNSGRRKSLTSRKTASVEPAWSPTADRIVYASTPDSSDLDYNNGILERLARFRIWEMRADGRHKRKLTNDPRYEDRRPRFTSDGLCIEFTRIENREPHRVSKWKMLIDGSAVRQTTPWREVKE